MSAPTVMRRGLASMKPSAHNAQPDAELRHVMTTGMSAPPMEEVRCAPAVEEGRGGGREGI